MRVIAAIALAVVIGSVQSKPSLSGTWVIDGAPTGLLGEKFSAVQTAGTLTLTVTVAALGRDVKVVYNLDGSESRNLNPRGPGLEDEPIFSRASWEGDKLIVLTRGTIPVNGKITESKRAIWIDKDGVLRIERSSEGQPTTQSRYRKSNLEP